jgi:hypothetical protein
LPLRAIHGRRNDEDATMLSAFEADLMNARGTR